MASPNINYQNQFASAPMSPQPANSFSTSTKVVNLSRNNQPQHSPGYNYPTQSYQTTQFGEMQQNARPASAQPQVFTVGMNPHAQQSWQQQQQPPYQQQTQQQYRVITTPLQPTSYNSPNVIYFGQQPQTIQQTPPHQQQYQQPYQSQPYQSQSQGHTFGQVTYARPANQSPVPSMTTYTPMVQSNNNTTTYPTTNDHTALGQPIAVQYGQQTYNQVPSFQHVSTGSSYSPQPLHQHPVTNSTNHYTPSAQANSQQVPSQAKATHQLQQAAYPVQTQVAPQNQGSQINSKQSYLPQQDYTGLPPTAANQTSDPQQLRRRIPSTEGTNRQIKVKSLPMRNSSSCDGLDAVGPPQFVLHPIEEVNVAEGEPASLKAVVRPAGDSSLQVEWYRNGKPLSAASRFTTTFDRGYAVLDFLYTNAEDTGDYSCVATNSQGQDQSASCHVNVIPEERVITDTQLPEESMIANLAIMEENLIKNELNRSANYADDTQPQNPPTFLKPLASQIGLKESAAAHFETYVEPANDPNLIVEWYKDGRPVTMGCRFNTVLDRGFALLDIHYCYPEDNGSYFCVAKNAAGHAQSNVVELQCNAEEGIVTSSVLSKESVSYLQSLDSWNSEQMAGYDTVRQIDEEQESQPVFDILPSALTVTEGSPARFLVKAGGYPRPKVYWFINGDMMASQGGCGNWRIYQDGGISYLEFHRVGQPATFNLRVVARNKLGEASAETTMIIEPQLDFRPDLRHVAPENPFKKLAQLKKVQCSNELTSALRRPKAQAMDLRCLERELEHKGRLAASNDVIETENMYSRVQAQLRSHRRSSQPPAGETPTRNGTVGPNCQPQQHPRQAMTPQPHVQTVPQQHQQQQVRKPGLQPGQQHLPPTAPAALQFQQQQRQVHPSSLPGGNDIVAPMAPQNQMNAAAFAQPVLSSQSPAVIGVNPMNGTTHIVSDDEDRAEVTANFTIEL